MSDGGDGQADGGGVQTDVADQPDWVKMNKKFRQKSGLWCGSLPGPRMVMLAMTVRAAEKGMALLLDMAGDEWHLRQRWRAAQGAGVGRTVEKYTTVAALFLHGGGSSWRVPHVGNMKTPGASLGHRGCFETNV